MLQKPIVPKESSGPLRIIVVTKSTELPRRRDKPIDALACSASYYSSGALARSYLDVLHDGPVETVMTCKTAADASRHADFEAAMTLIANGKVDLVITTDLTRFSRRPAKVMEFLQFCAAHSTRVISFEDRLDTGDDN